MAKNYLNWPLGHQTRLLNRMWDDCKLQKDQIIEAFDLIRSQESEEELEDSDISYFTIQLERIDEDIDDLLINFDVISHLCETLSHKKFIRKVYDLFHPEFFKNVTKDQIMNHDNSKLTSFIEVIGYTERWVTKNPDGDAWKLALKHHYEFNKHHPQNWTDFHGNQRDMDIEYLEESLIDMLACEWERKLNGREDVTRLELVAGLDRNFFQRYTSDDRIRVEKIIQQIVQEKAWISKSDVPVDYQSQQ